MHSSIIHQQNINLTYNGTAQVIHIRSTKSEFVIRVKLQIGIHITLYTLIDVKFIRYITYL